MTGEIDAYAAWVEHCTKHGMNFPPSMPPEFEAGFAAAEGPWREHLATDAEALKSGMLGTSQFAYGYRTACVDLAARIVQRGTDE